jgi:hypothetical protein
MRRRPARSTAANPRRPRPLLRNNTGIRMVVASLTPRVRTIVICDAVSSSRTEDRVFTLKGVRQHLEAASFPWRATLRVFLLLSSPRKGRFPGRVLILRVRPEISSNSTTVHLAA